MGGGGQVQSAAWVFTRNNPEKDELGPWPESVRYVAYQKEMGLSGTMHLQGYIEMESRKRRNTMCSLIPGAHWEPRKGTQEQAIAYVCKSDTQVAGPWFYGKPLLGKGNDGDLAAAIDLVREGVRASEIAAQYPTTWVRHSRGLLELALRTSKPRMEPPTVTVLWGSTGSGKSRFVFDKYKANDIFVVPDQGMWMDGYEGQPVVLFDEFYGGIPWSQLLRLTDRYPYHAAVKGGFVNFAPTHIVFTSNRHPGSWYPNIRNHAAFARRVSSVIKLGDQDYEGHGVYGTEVTWPDKGVESVEVDDDVSTLDA